MPKEEKTRKFDSETLILPALKMVLTEDDNITTTKSAKKAKKKIEKDFSEETVMRIIDKLIMKE